MNNKVRFDYEWQKGEILMSKYHQWLQYWQENMEKYYSDKRKIIKRRGSKISERIT